MPTGYRKRTTQTGPVTLYVSHGAGTGNHLPPGDQTVDWFIVEPRDDPERLAAQVETLRRSGRTVVELSVAPYEASDG